MPIDMRLYMKERRDKRRVVLIEFLGSTCSCGSTNDLEIDHIDPSTKSFTLSEAGLDTSWNVILEEAKKCQLLCKQCHSIKTINEHKQRIPWNKNLDNFIHGTARTYQEKKCKCDDCRQAKVLYRQKLISYTEHLSVLAL